MTGSRRGTGRAPLLMRVGRFFGVPLYFAPSWILIATAITITYSALLRSLVDGLGTGPSYLAALGFAVALALCVLAHEVGHTAVALALGRPVRRIVIYLLGGVSEISDDIERPRDELVIALAGPLVSGLLAVVAAVLHVFTTSSSLPGVLLALLAWSNLGVAVFNLLPGLPLDGGRALRAAIWSVSHSARTATTTTAWIGRGLAGLIGLTSILLVTQHWGWVGAVVGLVLAAFVWDGATRALRAADFRDRIAALRTVDFLRPALPVFADVSVAEALRRAGEGGMRWIFVIDAAERPVAIVQDARVRELPPERLAWTPVSAVARALEPGLVLNLDLGAGPLIEWLRRTPSDAYLVVDEDGAPAGILAAADIAIALGTT